VSGMICSANLYQSISREYHTLGGHCCRPSNQLDAPMTAPGAPSSASTKSGSTDNMSGSTSNHSRADCENNIYGNADAVPHNHSYDISFKDSSISCILFVFSSSYLCIYIATDLQMVNLDRVHAVRERYWAFVSK